MTDINCSILFLRAGLAFLYIYAAYMNSRDKASLQWTVDNTKPLFRNTKLGQNPSAMKLIAYSGILIMYAGGVSILFGIEARAGALLLLVFTAGGTVIHCRLMNDAKAIALNNAANPEMSAIAWSAYSAHFANILKNVSFLLIFVFVCLNGAGKYAVCDFIFNLLIKH